MRVRAGFSLMELVFVLILVGVVGAMAAPNVGHMLTRTKLQRAANTVAFDIQAAFATAARQRAPVRIVVDAPNRVITVQDHSGSNRIYAQHRFDGSSELNLSQMLTSPSTVVVHPHGLAESALQLTLRAGGASHTVSMTRAGQVRIQ